MIAAIIPAKGHSEGVKNKNVKLLGNKELVRYTIEAALNAKNIDAVFVTTESSEIDRITRSYTTEALDAGKQIRVLSRPPEHLLPHVQVDEVVLFAFRQMQRFNNDVEYVVVLQPTSPFRTGEQIDQAIELHLLIEEGNSVVGVNNDKYVYTVDGPEARPCARPYDHRPEQRLGRQDSDYGSAVVENGALYVVCAKALSEQRTFRATPFTPFYMDWVSGFEIDDEFHWKAAEALVKHVYSS